MVVPPEMTVEQQELQQLLPLPQVPQQLRKPAKKLDVIEEVEEPLKSYLPAKKKAFASEHQSNEERKDGPAQKDSVFSRSDDIRDFLDRFPI